MKALTPEVVVEKIPWKCLDCHNKWMDRADGKGVQEQGCPKCGSHKIFDCNVARIEKVPSSVLDLAQEVIDHANHDPAFVDEVALVIILERTLAGLNQLRAKFPRLEHTQAAGHLRSALSIERTLLAEYQERGGVIVGAVAGGKAE